ncbi:MAG: hypothetical protein ACFB0D_02395 [Phormidesmis sp.]
MLSGLAARAVFAGLCVYPLTFFGAVFSDYRVSTMVREGPLPENEFNSRNTASTQLPLQ